MSVIDKYQRNSIIEIENFANYWRRQDLYVDFHNYLWAGTIDNWTIYLSKEKVDNKVVIRLILPCVFPKGILQIRVRVFVNPINTNTKLDKYRHEKRLCCNFDGKEKGYYFVGKLMDLKELSDPDNGWLDENGIFRLEYGIYVESTQDDRGIRQFNFNDIPYDSPNNCLCLHHAKEDEYRYFHKQLITYHSPSLRRQCGEYGNIMLEYRQSMTSEQYEQFMQIAHGVRMRLSYVDLFAVAYCGSSMKNVVSYCENQMKRYYFTPITDHLYYALHNGFNRYSSFLMNHVESSERLKKILEDVNIQRMTGEGMKQCVKFLFDNS